MSAAIDTNRFTFGQFIWWMGVVEERKDDPKKLGRVKVRVFGYHTDDKDDIPTDDLMWAMVMQPVTSAAISGIGTSPTGLLEGSHVFGFFMDGTNAQVPIIVGSYGAIPVEKNPDKGFFDPNNVYPSYPLEEPDTNRLARNEKIDKTIVKKKRDGKETGVAKAFGGTWDEPETPYAAKYPYNHVRETESGHVVEYDDTEGAERIAWWHKAGTFEEVHPDGTVVRKIVGDGYEIVASDKNVYVKGDMNITVNGDSKIKVNGNAKLEIMGDKQETVMGNSTLQVMGNYSVTVMQNHLDVATLNRSIKATRIDLN